MKKRYVGVGNRKCWENIAKWGLTTAWSKYDAAGRWGGGTLQARFRIPAEITSSILMPA